VNIFALGYYVSYGGDDSECVSGGSGRQEEESKDA
jgi:hypothetical protein